VERFPNRPRTCGSFPDKGLDGEKELVFRAARGDERAFSEIVVRYQRSVYLIARSVLSDPDRAWDAAQDTFIRLYARLGTFRGEAPLKTWITRVALHVAIDHRRRSRRFPEQSIEVTKLARASDPGRLPDEELARVELAREMQGALSRLGTEQRTILTLREVEGLPYAEIAQVLEIPVGTVMSRLFYARHALRELLKSRPEALAA
jgi:RNA polymerase sigma-70 factor (ECF subfamily)